MYIYKYIVDKNGKNIEVYYLNGDCNLTGKEFIELLNKEPVLFDGAMGTELYKKGIFINKCYDELNLTNPDLVRQVHREYKKSGVDVLETNTFGANRAKLSRFQLQDKLYEINYEGAKLAREIAGDILLVAGSVGPLRIQMEPRWVIFRGKKHERCLGSR
jgi:homocysteine S-methyltransferase